MRPLSPVELAAYDHVPREVAAGVRIVRTPVLPPGAGGMTIGRVILLKRDDPADRTGRRELLAHELVHARQWRELGLPLFGGRYLRTYARNLRRLRRHRDAYLTIPLEEEARALAAQWARARDERRQED